MTNNIPKIEIDSLPPDTWLLSNEFKLKIAHFMFWKFSSSLEDVSIDFLKNTNTLCEYNDNISPIEISDFIKWWKWLIISNHSSITFADYLPLFARLWDEVLKKCVFFNWYKVIKANSKEFKDYVLRATNSVKSYNKSPEWKQDINSINPNFSWTKKILETIDLDISRITSNEWWYVFLIPMWEWDEWNFKWIFKRFIKWLPSDFPVLVANTYHENPRSYWEIMKNYFLSKVNTIIWDTDYLNKTTITARNATAWEFKWLDWEEQKQKYYEILWVKND